MANVNLQHVTKFSLKLCPTAHFFYPKVSTFTLLFSIALLWTVFLSTFSILRNSELESDVGHLLQMSL